MNFLKSILLPAYQLLDNHRKKMLFGMTGWMVLQSLMDFISLLSAYPILLLITSPGRLFHHHLWMQWRLLFPVEEKTSILCFIGATAFLFSIKYLLSHQVSRVKAKFAFDAGHEIAIRCLRNFQNQNHLHFLKIDYALEINRVANLPVTFANNVILPSLTLISETIIFISLLVAAAWYDLQALSLMVISLLPLAYVFARGKQDAGQISKEVRAAYPRSLKAAMQAVEGHQDIAGLGKTGHFGSIFSGASKTFSNLLIEESIFQGYSSRLTELVAGFMVCGLAVYVVIVPPSGSQTMMTLAVFGTIGLRLLPSMSRIASGYFQIRRHEYVVQELCSIEMNQAQVERVPLHFNETASWKHLNFSYDHRSLIIQDSDLFLRKGESVAITGPSGCGKTTLLHLLGGRLNGTGEFRVDGDTVKKAQSSSWSDLVAFIPQQPYMVDGTIAENIVFGSTLDTQRILSVLRSVELSDWVEKLPSGINTPVGERGALISGGQRQRIVLARALYSQRPILMMDEITNQLDAATQIEIFRNLIRLTPLHTIVMVTHHEDILSSVSRIVSVAEGRIKERIAEDTSS